MPTSKVLPIACARLASFLVGAVKHCMQLLLAVRSNELKILMSRWPSRLISLFLPQLPMNMIAVPSSIARDLIGQMRRARLIHSTTIATMAPKVTLIPQLFIGAAPPRPLRQVHQARMSYAERSWL